MGLRMSWQDQDDELEREYAELTRPQRNASEGSLAGRDRTEEMARFSKQREVAEALGDPALLDDVAFDAAYAKIGVRDSDFDARARTADAIAAAGGEHRGSLLTREELDEQTARAAAILLQQRAAQRKADRATEG